MTIIDPNKREVGKKLKKFIETNFYPDKKVAAVKIKKLTRWIYDNLDTGAYLGKQYQVITRLSINKSFTRMKIELDNNEIYTLDISNLDQINHWEEE